MISTNAHKPAAAIHHQAALTVRARRTINPANKAGYRACTTTRGITATNPRLPSHQISPP